MVTMLLYLALAYALARWLYPYDRQPLSSSESEEGTAASHP